MTLRRNTNTARGFREATAHPQPGEGASGSPVLIQARRPLPSTRRAARRQGEGPSVQALQGSSPNHAWRQWFTIAAALAGPLVVFCAAELLARFWNPFL